MNDLEGRMGSVDLSGRGRNTSVGEYNRKQAVTHTPRPILNICCQDRRINNQSRLHRPTWVQPISVTLPQRGMPRQTPRIRSLGMEPTSTVLPLRTAVHPNRLFSRARGPLRPIPWVGQALYMVNAPRRPVPVQCTAETDLVPHRPSPAPIPRPNTLNRLIDPGPRRPTPEHLLPLTTGRQEVSHILMVLRVPHVSAVARPWRRNRTCYLHPMGSVVPQIWLSRTLSSTL